MAGKGGACCSETNESTDRHQEIISIMTEGKVAHNRNRERGEELAQQELELGFAAAVFQLPDDHTTDAFESTGQPEGGQHSVDAIRPFFDLLPEPDSSVEPEVVRGPDKRLGQRETSAEQRPFSYTLKHYLRFFETMRE